MVARRVWYASEQVTFFWRYFLQVSFHEYRFLLTHFMARRGLMWKSLSTSTGVCRQMWWHAGHETRQSKFVSFWGVFCRFFFTNVGLFARIQVFFDIVGSVHGSHL